MISGLGEETPFRVNLLGSLSLVRGGEEFHLGPGEQRLVAFLAIHDYAPKRSFVASSLWPDTTESRAQSRLRTALWRLHQGTGDGLLRTDGHEVRWDEGVHFDVQEVRTRLDRFAHGNGPEIRPEELSRDLLEGWYDDWVLVAREQFRQLRLDGLERLCEHLTAVGRYAEAVQAGLAAVAAEPLRESAHVVVLRAHCAQGNPAEAVSQYLTYARLIYVELGLRPRPIEALLPGADLRGLRIPVSRLGDTGLGDIGLGDVGRGGLGLS